MRQFKGHSIPQGCGESLGRKGAAPVDFSGLRIWGRSAHLHVISRELGGLVPLNEIQTTAVKETLREVLSAVRPVELFMIDEVFEPTVSVSRRADPIGFGGGMEVALWIYPMFGFLKQLAEATATSFAKQWGAGLAKRLWPDHKSESHEAIDPSALQLMRCAMVQRLEKDGITTDDSERVADRLVALFVANPALLQKIVVKK
jgi:hypothetical protein